MISDYYHRQYTVQRLNAKSIKLKNNQYTLQPFMIPQQHFHPNKRIYDDLKDRCQKIKTQFSFIKNQIQRQHKRKKQKQQQSQRISKSIVDKQNRQSIQRQMTLTCKKLLKLHQFRKLNFQSVKNQKLYKKNKRQMQQYLIGQPVSFSPRKHSADKGLLKSIIRATDQNWRHTMADQ